MANLRLFVGIGLPSGLIDQLAAILESMKSDLPFRKWTHPDDLHITLHFLGDTREEQLDSIRAITTDTSAATTPVQLALTEPGTFGPPHAPRILWLGVAEPGGAGGLARLHAALAPGLAAAGFKPDERPFRAHVTLARQGDASCGSEQVRAAWRSALTMVSTADRPTETSADISPLSWRADRITLFRSLLGRTPSYDKIEEWPFIH